MFANLQAARKNALFIFSFSYSPSFFEVQFERYLFILSGSSLRWVTFVD